MGSIQASDFVLTRLHLLRGEKNAPKYRRISRAFSPVNCLKTFNLPGWGSPSRVHVHMLGIGSISGIARQFTEEDIVVHLGYFHTPTANFANKFTNRLRAVK